MFDSVYDDFFSNGLVETHIFDAALSRVKNSKSPGSPLVHSISTNEPLKSTYYAEFREAVDNRLANYESLGSEFYEIFLKDPSEFISAFNVDDYTRTKLASFLVDNNMADPVLLKVKNEPRKLDKQPRLVCMVSVIDNVCARLIMGDMLKEEQSWSTPTAVALDITTQEVTAKHYAEFKANAPLTSSDVQGWEYSNRFDTHLAELLRRAYCMKVTDLNFNLIGSRKHLNAIIGMTIVEGFRVLQTQAGCLFTAPVGLITSGALSTFSANSFKRAYVSEQVAHVLGVPLRYQKCAGDDNLDTNAQCTNLYRQLGYVVTDYTVQHDEFSFCSTTFTSAGSYGDNIEKFFIGCMYDKSYWDEKMVAYQNYKHHPSFDQFRELLAAETPTDRPVSSLDGGDGKFGLWLEEQEKEERQLVKLY